MTVLAQLNEPRAVKLTVRDFLRLDEAGAFERYARTELIDGMVIEMNAQYSAHARVHSRLFRKLADAVERAMPGYEALVEVSVILSEVSLPEPDIVITSFPAAREPVPAETVALVVEVSDSTLSFDLTRKARLYADAGVPEYWVVDVEGRSVRQHADPSADGYTRLNSVPFDDTLVSLTIPALAIETDRL